MHITKYTMRSNRAHNFIGIDSTLVGFSPTFFELIKVGVYADSKGLLLKLASRSVHLFFSKNHAKITKNFNLKSCYVVWLNSNFQNFAKANRFPGGKAI